jgi:hypothetical protein
MWRALILLGVLAVACVVVILTAHDSNEPQPDPATLPPAYMEALGQLTTPFTPRLDLGRSTFNIPKDNYPPINVPASSERNRIATFVLRSGPVVRIMFCPSGDDCSRDQVACVVPDGHPLPGGCHAVKNPGPKASIAVGSTGGQLTFSAPGGAATIAVE